MATTAHPYHERRTSERRRIAYPGLFTADGMKVSWGGIFGGVLVAVGLMLLLSALGLAVGVSATQPGETEASTLGTGAGIWAGVSLLLALFVGGMASTRIGAIWDGTTGFFEGALVWVVSILLVLYLATSGIGMLAGGASSLIGGSGQAPTAAEAKAKVGEIVDKAKSEEMQQKAEEMKPAATRGTWIGFGALVLSLAAAVLGAMAGRRKPAALER